MRGTISNHPRKPISSRHGQAHIGLLFVLLGQLLGANVVCAQGYLLEWFTFDAGGGPSSGDGYSLNGSIGQLTAGTATADGYTLVGGYWGVGAELQAPNAPLLTITRNLANGGVTIAWPLPATGFVLDETPALGGPTFAWMQLSFPYQTNATHIFITLPTISGNKFYRLRKP